MRSAAAEAPVLSKFDEYLVDFQVDLKKIIGKHRHPNHFLSADELLSEVNLSLFNKKEDIINCDGQAFNRVNFGKVAYAYARNLIVWTHCRDKASAYRRKMVDGVHQTEDGEKTVFELACELEGEEDERFESFDAGAKSKYVIKLLREYAHILTERELEILRLMTKDMNQEAIGEELGITHQAVSAAFINISSKIKNYLNFDYKTDSSAAKVTEGFKSIKEFFEMGQEPVMSKKDRYSLVAFLIDNSGRYSIAEVARKFEGGKFFEITVRAFINFNGLTQHVVVKNPSSHVYSGDEVELLLNLAEGGRSIDEISDQLGRSVRSVSSKCSHLLRTGELSKRPHRRGEEQSDTEMGRVK